MNGKDLINYIIKNNALEKEISVTIHVITDDKKRTLSTWDVWQDNEVEVEQIENHLDFSVVLNKRDFNNWSGEVESEHEDYLTDQEIQANPRAYAQEFKNNE